MLMLLLGGNMMKTTKYFIPTRNDVESLKVGDLALSVFGWAEVVEIYACGTASVDNKAYVCFYVETKKGIRVSSSYREGSLCRTMEVTRDHSSYECDQIERDMLEKNLSRDGVCAVS